MNTMNTAQDEQGSIVPPREAWLDPPPPTEAGEVLTDLVVTTFRLHARLMEVAQELAAEGGLTAAWWQVLGGVLDEPRSVAEIGRRMGMTRQGVRRVADLLVERRLAEFRPTPAHSRVRLLACTEAGYWAIRRIALVQRPWADRIAAKLGTDELRTALTTMQHLVAVLEADPPALATAPPRSHGRNQVALDVAPDAG
jgi:DNA-binding MarR family transcriptional regulator